VTSALKKQKSEAVKEKEEADLRKKFDQDLQAEKMDKQFLKDTKTYMGQSLKIQIRKNQAKQSAGDQ
jgi:hypothetical protein